MGARFLLPLLGLLLSPANFAAAEPYSARPDILDPAISAARAAPNADWQSFKTGALNFLAEMTALYPDDDYYFLARDGEYLHDALRVLAKDDPALLHRLRLVNVSTAISNDPRMRAYLEQEGLTKEGLRGKSAILIDTCCGASIPEKVKAAYPDLPGQVKGHFLTSFGDATPSSRVFIEAYEPGKKVGHFDNRLGIKIEDFPHFTSSAAEFVSLEGKLVPSSPLSAPAGSKERARAMMGDIKSHFSDPALVAKFGRLRATMGRIAAHARGEQTLAPAELARALGDLRAEGVHNFVEDLADANTKGTARLPKLAEIQAAEAALPAPAPRYRIVRELPAEEGRSFRAVDENGKPVLLRQAETGDAAAIQALRREADEASRLARHKLPHAAVRENSGTLLVRDWIEGERGDQWLKKWRAAGSSAKAEGLAELAHLFREASRQGVYVKGLDPRQLVWTGREWIIMNAPKIKEGLPEAEALARYLKKVPKLWVKAADPESCAKLFAKALKKKLAP